MVSKPVTCSSIWRSALRISWLCLASCGSAQHGAPHRDADLVFVGGDVRTMDLARPHATAVAVTGDVIAAVGSDADVQPWIGKHTQVVQLRPRS